MSMYDDWVVTGAGPGGGVAGLRLAERGHRALALEGGRRFEPAGLPTGPGSFTRGPVLTQTGAEAAKPDPWPGGRDPPCLARQSEKPNRRNGVGRTVRAEVVAALLLGAAPEVPDAVVSPRLAGAWITGWPDLSGAEIGQVLWLKGCRLEQELSLCGALTRTGW